MLALNERENSNLNNIDQNFKLTRSGNSENWPMYGNNPSLSGFSNSDAPREHYINWTFNTTSSVESIPVVLNNIALFGDTDNVVHALSIDNGKEIWNYTTNGVITSSPAVENNIVIIGSWDGYIYALNIDSGKLIWKYDTNQRVTSPAIIKNSILYIGTTNDSGTNTKGRLFAFDLDINDNIDEGNRDPVGANYDLLWYQNFSSDVINPTLVWEEKIYINVGGNIFIFNELNGKLLITIPDEGDYTKTTPSIINNKLFLTGLNNSKDNSKFHFIKCYNPTNFELIWKFEKEGEFYPPIPSGSDGEVFFSGLDTLYALPIEDPNNDGSINDDEIIWSHSLPSGQSPAITLNEVVVTNLHDIYCFDRSTGDLIWFRVVSGDSFFEPPVIAMGKIFVSAGSFSDFTVFSSYPSTFPSAALKTSTSEGLTMNNINFDASESTDDEGIDKYYFDFGDGTDSGWTTNYTITHNYSKAGDYIVKLKVIDNHRLESNYTEILLKINNRLPILPEIPDKEISIDQKLILSETLENQIFDIDGFLVFVELDFGDGNKITKGSKDFINGIKLESFSLPDEHKYKKSGNYKVKITAIDNDGGTNNTSFKVNVKLNGFLENPSPIKLIFYFGILPLILIIITIVFIVFRRRIKIENKRLK
jgi:outer membrane protein assembly factor BamB